MSSAAKVRAWLMTGVSYVIPFVAAGGLLIALGYAIGGHQVSGAPPVTEGFDWTSAAGWAALLFQLGGLTFGFLVPVLGGFIAYAIAGRPALVPGFVGGWRPVPATSAASSPACSPEPSCTSSCGGSDPGSWPGSCRCWSCRSSGR
jgi:fructose-specific phosphotransferase system IIC component